MAKPPKEIAASVRQRLLNLARQEGQVFDVVLVAFCLERLVYHLSVSDYHVRFVLKGGMLVTLWTADTGRFTRDIDFLAFGSDEEAELKVAFDPGIAQALQLGTHLFAADRREADGYALFGRGSRPLNFRLECLTFFISINKRYDHVRDRDPVFEVPDLDPQGHPVSAALGGGADLRFHPEGSRRFARSGPQARILDGHRTRGICHRLS